MRIHINKVYPWNCGETEPLTTTNEKDVNCPKCKALQPEEKPFFRFPRTKFVDETTHCQQEEKVMSEAIEVRWAETPEHKIEELLDVIQAAETGLRKYQEEGHDIKKAAQAMVAKNSSPERSYYKAREINS